MIELLCYLFLAFALVWIIKRVRRLLYRPRNLFIDGEARESRPAVLSHLRDGQIPDVTVEREVSRYLYPEER